MKIEMNYIDIDYKIFYKVTNNGFGRKPNKPPAGLS